MDIEATMQDTLSLSSEDRSTQPPATKDIMVDTPLELVLTHLAIVKERYKGHISLTHETLQLVKLLPNNDPSNEAYQLYLDQLTEIDHK